MDDAAAATERDAAMLRLYDAASLACCTIFVHNTQHPRAAELLQLWAREHEERLEYRISNGTYGRCEVWSVKFAQGHEITAFGKAI